MLLRSTGPQYVDILDDNDDHEDDERNDDDNDVCV